METKLFFNDDDFNKMISKTKIGTEYKIFFENTKRFNQKEIYHLCWQIIHSMHNESSEIQLNIFFKILKILSLSNCSCGYSGYKIFFDIVNSNLENFINLDNKKSFLVLGLLFLIQATLMW